MASQMWVGPLLSVAWIKQDSRLTFLYGKGIPPALLLSNWNISFFPAFLLDLKHQLFLDLKPAGLQVGITPSVLLVLRTQMELYCWLSGSPVCQFTLQILGLVSFNNHVSQFLIIISVYTSYRFCFSGEL